MKTISIWNPFATLIMEGFKTYETRRWPASAAMVGNFIAVASTTKPRPDQRRQFETIEFLHHYAQTELPPIEELCHGCVLGIVVLEEVLEMTEELIEAVGPRERAFGYWTPGNYAWRLRSPHWFRTPIPVKGKQGFYSWKGT